MIGRHARVHQQCDFVLVRGDLKTGRSGSRTPFQILAGHYQTGDTRDRDLWREIQPRHPRVK